MSDLLRLVTCGSVDDGKSTLIGRLLYDSGSLLEDQLGEIETAAADAPDFSLALDGLAAEREQGITIDVAYRSFSTPQRRFLIADVPGHEQYTRNMITGASAADVALLVLDVRSGVLRQTRRHAYLAWLLGIRRFILAVNKMDLVDFSKEAFRRVVGEYDAFVAQLGAGERYAIPISARFGDNVFERSRHTPWHDGRTLLDTLHEIRIGDAREAAPFRLPVQWVNRSTENLRGYSGLVAAGTINSGDPIRVQPSDQAARVQQILTFDGSPDRAVAGQSVTLVLDRPLDIGRGHLISGADAAPSCADSLEATLVWMGDSPLLPGRSYRLKLGARSVVAQVAQIRHRIDVDTLVEVPAGTLTLNEIGICSLALDEPVAFDFYEENRDTGGFILIDRVTNDTIAAGLIRAGELNARNVPWQAIEVSKSSRSSLKKHPPAILWFTGISGAGKSTIANLVEKMLHARGVHTYLLDGDNVRHGLNRDLGFSDADRVENVRRVGEVAKLMADAGLIVLVALISPFRAERRVAREMVPQGEFIEIYVDTPLHVAEARDVKGLYRRARRGGLRAFTGIDSAYEVPEHPELHIETTRLSAEDAAQRIVAHIDGLLAARSADKL
jgi:bifunctional enzyme CysN/CysC